jgi:hypothetical protein
MKLAFTFLFTPISTERLESNTSDSMETDYPPKVSNEMFVCNYIYQEGAKFWDYIQHF